MHVGAQLASVAARALAAVDVQTMEDIGRRLLNRYYDLHERTGFQSSIPVPKLDAARQVINDVRASGKFLEFVNLLLQMQEQGLVGRTYQLPHLRELVRGVHDLGFDYDQETRMFVEDPRVRKSPNWGVLREGEPYVFTFVRLDVVDNSTLVRRFARQRVEQAYGDLAAIVGRCVDRQNGRVWSWEGDGGLAAFFFSNKNTVATLAAMAIIHELFFYNHLMPRLEVPLEVRVAVHNGVAEYTSNVEEIKKNETIKRTIQIESKYTRPSSVTVSNTVYTTLEPRVANQLSPVTAPGADGCHSYQIRWEK
jgi:class 3 adenylate cyclase